MQLLNECLDTINVMRLVWFFACGVSVSCRLWHAVVDSFLRISRAQSVVELETASDAKTDFKTAVDAFWDKDFRELICAQVTLTKCGFRVGKSSYLPHDVPSSSAQDWLWFSTTSQKINVHRLGRERVIEQAVDASIIALNPFWLIRFKKSQTEHAQSYKPC